MGKKIAELSSWVSSLIIGGLIIWTIRLTFFYRQILMDSELWIFLTFIFIGIVIFLHSLIFRRVLPNLANPQKRSVFILLLCISLLLGMVLAYSLKVHKNENLTFLPHHQLKIRVPKAPQPSVVELKKFTTSLNKNALSELKTSGDWRKVGTSFVSQGKTDSELTWNGIAGSYAELFFTPNPNGGEVEITWDEKILIIDLKRSGKDEISLSQDFPVNKINRWSMFVIVGLALVPFIFFPIDFLFSKTIERLQSSTSRTNQGIFIALLILIIGFIFIFLINNVFSCLDTQSWFFQCRKIVPALQPAGRDFRWGLYVPAQGIFEYRYIYEPPLFTPTRSLTGYPPVVYVLALPFILFSENTAYLIQVGLLIGMNLACLFLVVLFSKEIILNEIKIDKTIINLVLIIVFLLFAFYLFSSYPFIFSFERGNFDIVAIFFALIAFLCLFRYPDRIWVQVLLLSIAAHLKIYPGILFILLYFYHGRKLILPTIVINAILFMILGFRNAVGFFQAILYVSSKYPSSWIGNHSASSFTVLLGQQLPSLIAYLPVIKMIITTLPLLIWGFGMLVIFRGRHKKINLISGLMISVPLMEVLPVISHDYKLVIMNVTFMLLIIFLLKKIIMHGLWIDYLQLLLILIILLFVGRSYELINSYFALIVNKYLWVVLTELIILWNIPAFLGDSKGIQRKIVSK